MILCLKDQVPELWNFELTECVRPIARLTGIEKLIHLSDELIACVWQCRTLTPDELLVFSSFHSSVAENSSDLLPGDESVEQDVVESVDEGHLAFSRNSSLNINHVINYLKMSMISDSFKHFRMLVVDILSVTHGECVSSIKTCVSRDEDVRFISCNSQNQLLVCTVEIIVDGSIAIEHFTVSLRNNNSLRHVWERSEKRLEGPLQPCFMYSPEEQFVATWDSFNSGYGVHILNEKTGETRHSLLTDQDNIVDCKFFANCESLICCSKDNFLRLFNIRSGNLLSVLDIEERPQCLGACLGKPLVAIGLSGARLKFVHVELPSVQEAEGKKGEKSWLHITVLSDFLNLWLLNR